MYTLYSKSGSCSMAVHALLNELGKEVKIEPYQIDGATNPALKKINPRENVPTLVQDDFVMREGGAILSWLCDEYQSDLLPRSGKERAQAMQWLMFANATLHPAYARAFFLMRHAKEDQEMLLGIAIEHIQALWNEVEEALEGNDYICGSKMTVADILITVIANWSFSLPKTIIFGKNCKGLFARVSSRPAFQVALQDEKVAYKAAA